MPNDRLDEWLEAKFREYYPNTTEFFVGADDNDRLTLNAGARLERMTWTQTQANMENSDDEFFVFESDETGRVLTIPFPPAEEVKLEAMTLDAFIRLLTPGMGHYSDLDKPVLFNVFIDEKEYIMVNTGIADATDLIGIELMVLEVRS